MKALKYLLTGVLMSTISFTAMAQVTADDAVKAITNNAPDKEQVVKAAAKTHKKDAEGLVKIGRAYLGVNDIVNTEKFANLADAAAKHKSAAAFILMGDLAVNQDNGGKAAEMYQQAIYAEPTAPAAYLKYANIFRGKSPDTAVDMLNEMRKNCPNEPVDAYAAHIYYLSATQNAAYMPKALDYYKKADRSKLDKNQLIEFALTAFVSQENELSKQIAVNGLQKNPRYAGFNRLALYNSVELKQYDDAAKYVDALFNKSDSAEISGNDYKYAALTYVGLKDYDNAIKNYEKRLEQAEGDAKIAAYTDLSDTYKAKGDYDNAVVYYEKALEANPNAGANDWNGLATIYRNQAADLTGDAQIEAVNKAVAVYDKMADNFETASTKEFAWFMAARMKSQLDPKTTEGLALPYYDKLATSIENHGVKDNSDKTRIIEAYRYLGYYYLQKDQNETSKGYWLKLLEIDPENEGAQQVIEALN